jgi:hypothetical protein
MQPTHASVWLRPSANQLGPLTAGQGTLMFIFVFIVIPSMRTPPATATNAARTVGEPATSQPWRRRPKIADVEAVPTTAAPGRQGVPVFSSVGCRFASYRGAAPGKLPRWTFRRPGTGEPRDPGLLGVVAPLGCQGVSTSMVTGT